MMMFMLLDKLREMRAAGPAGYTVPEPEEAPCAAVYHKSLSPSQNRKWPQKPTPGPDYYYWKDDLVKETKPAFSFP